MYLKQLGGPPKYSLPRYDSPPFEGKKVYKGDVAGTILGPVLCIIHTPRREPEGSRSSRPGFVTAGIRNPFVPKGMDADEDGNPAIVYVKFWCSDNQQGQRTGVSYCEVVWYTDPWLEEKRANCR